MTILDAYAVLAVLRREAASEHVTKILRRGGASLTAIGLAEVIDRVIRLEHADADEAALDIAQLGLGDAVPTTASIAASAGRLRARHYHRIRCALSMADCIAAESARAMDRPLATADPSLLDVCHAEGIAVIPLPATDGAMWQPTGSADSRPPETAR